MTNAGDHPERSARDGAIVVAEPRAQLPPERVVCDGSCQLADAGLRGEPLTVDAARHDSACPDLLLGGQPSVGQPSRDPFPGIAGSEEIRISLEERERLLDRGGLCR